MLYRTRQNYSNSCDVLERIISQFKFVVCDTCNDNCLEDYMLEVRYFVLFNGLESLLSKAL